MANINNLRKIASHFGRSPKSLAESLNLPLDDLFSMSDNDVLHLIKENESSVMGSSLNPNVDFLSSIKQNPEIDNLYNPTDVPTEVADILKRPMKEIVDESVIPGDISTSAARGKLSNYERYLKDIEDEGGKLLDEVTLSPKVSDELPGTLSPKGIDDIGGESVEKLERMITKEQKNLEKLDALGKQKKGLFKKPFSETRIGRMFTSPADPFEVVDGQTISTLTDAGKTTALDALATSSADKLSSIRGLGKELTTKGVGLGESVSAIDKVLPVPQVGANLAKSAKWLEKGSKAGKLAKSAGLSAAASFITPEKWLRSDKEGLRTKYGTQDVLGRGLQAAKGVGLLALGDVAGGIAEIGQGIMGMFTDKAEVKKDKRIFNTQAREEAVKKAQQEYAVSQQKEKEEEMLLAQAMADKYARKERVALGLEQLRKGGIVSPQMSPYLSDSYKRYLMGGRLEGTRPESLKYEYRNGGMVYGPSHKNGGVKYNVGGRVVELEGGEAVINKKSTEMYKPILSAINQVGGGEKFAAGGIMRGGGLMDSHVSSMLKRIINK